MIEADHDLRTPTDMILLERVAKAVFHTAGIAQVQSITRPLGTPLDHTSIPFQISAQSAGQIQNLGISRTAPTTCSNRSTRSTRRSAFCGSRCPAAAGDDATHEQVEAFHQTVAVAQDLRDKIANFDDFFRPLRNYFYWEPHCFDIPICSALRSLFERSTGSTRSPTSWECHGESGQIGCDPAETAGTDPTPDRQPADQSDLIDDQLRHHCRESTIRMRRRCENATAMGASIRRLQKRRLRSTFRRRFSTTPDFKRGLKLFLSPDGKAARMIITHDGDPATPKASRISTRSGTQRRRPSRARRWRAPTSISAARRRHTRTSRTAPSTT